MSHHAFAGASILVRGDREREEILWGEFETGRLMGVGMSEGVQQLYRKLWEMR